MKFSIKFISLLIVIAIFVSALCVNVSATATPSICNTGERHVLCVSLSDMAEDYYTAGYDYSTLSQKTSTELLTALHGFMTNTHKVKTDYSDCKKLAIYTDSQANDEKVVLLYSSVIVTMAEWTSTGSNGWNREHVWPQSLGGFNQNKNDVPAMDLHHVRPADTKINGTRGDKLYGNVQNGTAAMGNGLAANVSGGTYAGNYFEPLDNVKGDVARICLYVYARYGSEYPKCSDITNVFQSVEVLLDWCELDPVDEWEMGRNDVVEAIQGNRNVFIDYPEYAWLLFGEEVPEEMSTPSLAAREAEGEQGGQGNQEPTTPSNPDVDTPENDTPENDTPENNTPENNTPENNTPENNTPENNTPENNTPESDATESESVKVEDNSEKSTQSENTNKTDKVDDDADSEGCGSSVAISSICFVGIAGIMVLVRKKED